MTVTDPAPDTIVGYRFDVTCPHCSGRIRQVQAVRQSPHSVLSIVECSVCNRQHDLTVRLTPLRRDG